MYAPLSFSEMAYARKRGLGVCGMTVSLREEEKIQKSRREKVFTGHTLVPLNPSPSPGVHGLFCRDRVLNRRKNKIEEKVLVEPLIDTSPVELRVLGGAGRVVNRYLAKQQSQ